MDAITNIIEGESSQFDIDSIDHDKLKSFQAKCTVWDFYDMTKEEYINKLPTEKQDLILSYYKKMVQGMPLFLLFEPSFEGVQSVLGYLLSSFISLFDSESVSVSESESESVE